MMNLSFLIFTPRSYRFIAVIAALSIAACDGGSSGPPGVNGTNGITGVTGATGAAGSTGPVGVNGPTGAAGAAGPSGSPGANGSAGIDGTSGSNLTWIEVTGTAVMAKANSGYLANSASQVIVMLPTDLEAGDTVRVLGVGIGGWKVAQQGMQSIVAGLTPLIWKSKDQIREWGSVASSADGNKLVATESVNGSGQIYTSTDSGATWTARESIRRWKSVASSANGNMLVFCPRNNFA